MQVDLYNGCKTMVVVVVTFLYLLIINFALIDTVCLQCFDAVGWAAGRASSL